MYLPRRMKVEPDLSLVRDKFLVRYECYINLFRFHSSGWFLYFYMFSSMLCRLSPESFNRLLTPVVN